ncbi:hypothetical protein VTO42DRAFT_5336 [Malbranchea cinnamomea]
MASSILPSTVFRRHSFNLVRSVSTNCSCSASYSSLSQLPRQLERYQPLRMRSSSISYPVLQSHQTRSLVTKLVRPFSKSKESKATPDQQTSSTVPNSSSENPLPLTNLPYFVRRTPSNQLPVYLVTKAGGTRQLTKLQKTEGDVDALRNDLVQALGLPKDTPDVQINRLNGHIIVKGWRKPEILKFLLERRF